MQSKDGSFKGNPLYFGRKKGGIVDVIEKMNKQNPKPEIKTVAEPVSPSLAIFSTGLPPV